MAITTMAEKLLAKAAELDEQAKALRLVAALLGNEATAGKVATVARRVSQAAALRKAQSNGHAVSVEVEAPAAPRKRGKRAPTGSQLAARRAAKRDEVLAIIRDYGKPMPIAALVEAARARGIDSLTGMISYVRAGYLTKSGSRGKTSYRFRQAPEQEQ